MLEPMLERTDREDLPILLDTSKEQNVHYYERFGFEVKRKYRVLGNDHWGYGQEFTALRTLLKVF